MRHRHTSAPTISVVIPCYNEEKYIGTLLERLCSQTVQPNEVIIADSNSTDNTISTALKFSDRLPIKIAHTGTHTPGSARNAGALEATKDFILFLDADCLPVGHNFIHRLQKSIQRKPTDFISSMFTSDGLHPLSYIFFWSVNFLLLTGIGFKGNVPIIGGMMFVRRSKHVEAGGMDETLRICEDTDYGRRLTKIGATHRSLPTLYVKHSNRRGRQEGHLRALLHSAPPNGLIGKRIHGYLQNHDKAKRYGQF